MRVIDTAPLGVAGSRNPTVLRIYGDIDLYTSVTLREELLSALSYSNSMLVLDLSEVTFCDAAGLAVLVDVQQRARPMGITLALAEPRPFMTRLLRITGLDRALPTMSRVPPSAA
ncbi:STAS domain-containing protein [Nonomuraea sp. NPDC049309]|uniref:STAS domain-containing protein n=1 Tax=Nonomuraea sp. NPDC049309 TaxID=3364350 RepID=UPI003712A1A7